MHTYLPLIALASLAVATPTAVPKFRCDPNAPSPYFNMRRQNAAASQKYVSDSCPSCATDSAVFAATYAAKPNRFFLDTYNNCSLKFNGSPIDPVVHLETDGLVNMYGYYAPANPDKNPERQIVCNGGSTAVNNTALQCYLNANRAPISLYHCGTDKKVYAFAAAPPASRKCVKQNIITYLA